MRDQCRPRIAGQLFHAPRAGHVLGQVEVVHPLGDGSLGNRRREMKRCRTKHRKLAGQRRAQSQRVGDVQRQQLQARAGFQTSQRSL